MCDHLITQVPLKDKEKTATRFTTLNKFATERELAKPRRDKKRRKKAKKKSVKIQIERSHLWTSLTCEKRRAELNPPRANGTKREAPDARDKRGRER